MILYLYNTSHLKNSTENHALKKKYYVRTLEQSKTILFSFCKKC
jgi:hypothetical protein